MRIQAQFPVLTKLAAIIEKKVEKVREDEKNKRQDLFVLASSYIAILKSKSSQLMTESSFHQVSDKVSKEEKAALNGGDSAKGKVADRKDGKDRERSEKKIIKITAERELKKETPVRESTREPPRASREPTREKSTKKEVKHEKEVRVETDSNRKREFKEKEVKRRDKRLSPVTIIQVEERFYDESRQRELSSVSNSSNGSIHQRSQEPAVIEIDQRGKKEIILINFNEFYLCLCFLIFASDLKRRKVETVSKVSIMKERNRDKVIKSDIVTDCWYQKSTI